MFVVSADSASAVSDATLLWAQQTAPDGPAGLLMSPYAVPIILLMLFYFLLFRPQQREQAARRAMLDRVKKNDRVLVAGGIYGVVTNVHREADEVTVKVDEGNNTKLKVTFSSLVRVLSEATDTEKDKT